MASPSRLRQARAVEKRNAILEASIAILFQSGVSAVTHRQVAAKASVPVGSIGYYFDSRDSLLVESLKELSARRSEQAQRLLKKISPEADISQQAQWLVDLTLPLKKTNYVGWVGVLVDSIRESDTLRQALTHQQELLYQDLDVALENMGRSDLSADKVNTVICGAVIASAARSQENIAEDVAQAVTELLSSN